MHPLRTALAAMLAATLAASCGDDASPLTTGREASTAEAPPTTEATGTASSYDDAVSTTGAPGAADADATGWVGLLASIPDSLDMAGSVLISDYAAARELLGIEVPGADADEDEVIEYLLAVQMGPVADASTTPPSRSPRMGIADQSFGRRAPYDLDAWRTAFGVSVVDVDLVATAGQPPAELTVWQGGIDPTEVGRAVETDPEWSADLRTVDQAGEAYYAWGDDPAAADVARSGPVRELGRGGCLYATEGEALRAHVCDVIEAAIDARSGAQGSLADLEPLAGLAVALQDAGAYAGFLTVDVGLFTAGSAPASPGGPALLPYLAAATGAALEGDTSVTVIGLAHSSPEDASENAVRLERVVTEGTSALSGRPWSDTLVVLDITTEGPLLVARLATETSGTFWFQFVAARDSLLAWE